MKGYFLKKIFLSLALICLLQIIAFSLNSDRYFDSAELDHKDIRLAVFYPSPGSIKALAALKKNGFLGIENIIVIGVYHEKERTNYNESKRYVQEQNLGWFKFHQVSADIKKEFLFKTNACSPEFESIFKKSDGIIFFGGPDIPPSIFGSKTNFLAQIEDPYRHYFELSAIFHLLGGFQDKNFKGYLESSPAFPVLGICLGGQSLNVGTGGTLVQDIWSETYGLKYLEDAVSLGPENWHKNPWALLHPEEKFHSNTLHPIKLEQKSKFCAIMGFHASDRPYILSSHHQQISKLGKGFWISATSVDGKVIEAIDHEKFPNVLGLQFHPESPKLWETDASARLTPQDKEPVSFKTILENNPPSFEFHKKLWSWFCQKLQENRDKK